MHAADVIKELAAFARPQSTSILQRFFKTGPGEYGEGDVFIGVKVPELRSICKQFRMLPLPEVQKLFDSEVHEHRLAAAIILVYQYPKSDTVGKKAIYDFYLANIKKGRVNNWDIVDSTAPGVVGRFLWEFEQPRDVLFALAQSNDLWHRRIGIMSSFYFFKDGDDPTITLELCELLVHDTHDLIQKAVGWMLREIGKRYDRRLLTDFLDRYAATMPRTALRYAIEHFSPQDKRHYMNMKSVAR